MNPFPIYLLQVSFFSLTLLKTLVEFTLNLRQFILLKKTHSAVPEDFKDDITLEEHQKASLYSQDKLRLGLVQIILSFLVFLVLFPGRGINLLYSGAVSFELSPIPTDLCFFLILGFLQYIVSLPFKLYSTFVIEEKYGFNKMTYKLFVIDQVKIFILSSAIGLPILYGVLWIFTSLGEYWWLWAYLSITAFQFIMVWVYPNWIAPLFNKFKELEDEDLKNSLKNLFEDSGFSLSELFEMDASKRSGHGNAYFSGLGKTKKIVLFDTLLKSLNQKQTLAVIAHELGHMKLNHIKKNLTFSLVVSFFSFALLGYLAQQYWFLPGHFIKYSSPGLILFAFTLVSDYLGFWISPLSSLLSRKFEFEADEFAHSKTNASDLIEALLKMYRDNSSSVVTDKWYEIFYYSHPSAKARISRLKVLARKG